MTLPSERVLTELEAKRLVASRGRQLESVVTGAASAAHEAIRMLRRELRGEGGDRWDAAPFARRRHWEERALKVGLGEIRTVRQLYAEVLTLRHEDDIARAWEGLLDWRLVELLVELQTLRLVMGSVLPEAVGPILTEAREGI